MTLAVNLANLANNVNASGQLNAASGLTGATPIANGGTGATTAAQARTNLGVPSTTGQGATGDWNISVANAYTAQTATYMNGGTCTFYDGTVQETAGYTGFRNRIINGSFNVNQYPISSTSVKNQMSYFTDRWAAGVTAITATYTASQQTGAGISYVGNNYMRISTDVPQATLGAGEYAYLRQAIEGYNVADFKYGTAQARAGSLTFIASASQDSVISVAFQSEQNSRSYVTTVNVTTTPKFFLIPLPGDTSGTWNTTTGSGLTILFCFASNPNGTFVAPSTNQWINGNYIAASTQSNGFSTAGRNLNITDVQFETDAPTPFEVRQYGTELSLCQRYFQVFPNGTAGGYGLNAVSTLYTPISFPVSMRENPSVGLSLDGGGGYSGYDAYNAENDGFTIRVGSSGSGMIAYNFHYTASAEL